MPLFFKRKIINQASNYFRIQTPEQYHDIILERFYILDPEELPLHPPSEVVHDDKFVYARVNHNRWLADCFDPACSNIMMINKGWPFMCSECGNGDGYYRKVVWPKDIEYVEKQLLNLRVDMRNWRPIIPESE